MKKRILSMLLAIVMVAGMLPTAAFAAEVCDHHSEHTADCGYVEGESECTYVCGESHGEEPSEEPIEESSEEPSEASAPVCTCESDDPAYHAPFCALYAAPEAPACLCVEQCAESSVNEWCDVCYFDHAACAASGEEEAAVYALSQAEDGYYLIANADDLYAFAEMVNSGNTAINGRLTADIVVNENVLNANGGLNGDGSNFRVWTPIGNNTNFYNGTFDGDHHSISGLYFDNPEQNFVGLFGYVNSNGKVQNVGVVNSYFSGKSYVGGVAGYVSGAGAVTNSHNTGTVKGLSRIGGVAGSSLVTIIDCYNVGTVICSEKNAGGVVGALGGNIKNSYNAGTVEGNNEVGGVAGYVYGAGAVTNSHNTGTVKGAVRVGGVVGQLIGSGLYCYNTGALECTVVQFGGLVGAIANNGNLQYSYSTGTLNGGTFAGGVAGRADDYATVNHCYYDTSVYSGSSISVIDTYCSVTNVEGKTAEQFASGEVAYLLGEAFGQNIDNGTSIQSSPVLGGTKVFAIDNCLGAFGGYSNSEDTILHITSEQCTICPCGADFHNYDHNTYKCTVCGTGCTHSFDGGICTKCGYYCEHDWDHNKMQYYSVCNYCGLLCGHSYHESYRMEATCSAQGLISYKCAFCTSEYHEILEALEHDYTWTYTDTTHEGYCSVGKETKTGFHNYSREYFDPTCTEDGYYAETCTDCGYTKKTVTSQKFDHYGGEATCKALAVCERCGEGYGEYADHIGGEATCAEQAICDVCGEGYGELKRHESDLDDSDCTTPVCCSVCGAITKEANATHTWDENNFCSNENCQQTRGFTFTFTYGDEVLFVRNVHTGNFYTFEDFEARDGLTLVGWDADDDGEVDYAIDDYIYVEGDLSFNAVYKLMYTVRFITYDIWEGSYTESFNPIMGEANQTVTLWDNASPHFKFLGWAMEEGGEVVYEANEEITLTQNLTLYGVIRPYRATFELGEGAVWNDENGNPITVLEGNYSGEWIEIRKFPTRTGYIFKGFMDQTGWFWEPWQDEDTGEWVVDFYFDRADLEMTAVWEECTEYNDNGFCTICGGYEPAELVGDYYEISNAGQLYWFAKQVNSGNRAINGKLTANIVVNESVLKADGTLNGDGSGFLPWTPMGNFKTSYTGTFDGNGKTVSGLYVNENTDYVGLFGNSTGTIKHVGVVDSYLSGDEWVGGVVGCKFGTVENCYNTGSVSGSCYVGGVVGYISGFTSTGTTNTVESCYNSGSVSGIGSNNGYVGGVVGFSYNSTITGCYNTGAVSGSIDVGGVVGSNSGTAKHVGVVNCYNKGSVSGNINVGGVAGYNDGGTITNCYNAGNLRGSVDVGGVVGYNNDPILNYISTVANCYYDSNIYSGNAIGCDSGAATAVLGKTTQQFASGEVAYLLSRGFTLEEGEGAVNYPGDVWGQNIDGEGETDAYPVFSDAKVYEVTNCKGETAGYSNTDEDTGHSFGEDGKCTICGEPDPEVPIEPAELAIIKQPVSVTGTIGETVSVTVVATGEGLTYQWYIRNDGGSWSRSSTTTATYEVVMNKSRANRELYCIITDANGNTLKTDVVSMTGQPNEELKILTQPTNAEAKLGENYCVEVIAQGDGLTYTWYWRNKGQERWNISGVKDNTYDDVMNASRAGREVYCVITDAWGNSVTTSTATLIGLPQVDLAIVTQPNDSSAKLNEPFCVTVEAQGEGLTYTWYWRNKGQERWNISGVKDNTYDDVMTRARHNREVYCVITDAFGNTVTSDIALITGEATMKLEITQQPTDAEAKLNQMYCVTVEAVGEDIHYQWYFKNKGSEQWSASSVKDNTYDDIMTSARVGREIYCVITDAWGNRVTTDTVSLVAIPDMELAITAQPEDESVKMDEMFCVTVEAQGDGLKYQWYWRQVGSENWNVSGQRDNTYDDVMTKARHNREVYCVITDAWGERVETNVVTITAIPSETLAIVTQPTDASAAMGDNYCVTVEAVGDGLTYTWYFKNAGTNTWSKSGVTDNTYDDVMTKTRAGRQVYCVITDAFGNQVTTESVTLICTDIPQAIAMN